MHKESFVLVAVPWSVSRFPDTLGLAKTFVQKVPIEEKNSSLLCFFLDNLKTYLGCGFKHFLLSPLFGEDSHFDKYFSNGLKPPTSKTYLR